MAHIEIIGEGKNKRYKNNIPNFCLVTKENLYYNGLYYEDYHSYKEIDYVRRKENLIQRYAGHR